MLIHEDEFIGRTMRGLSGLQGVPAQTVQAGMERVTTERAPMTAPSPMLTPGPSRQPEAIQLCEAMVMGAAVSWKNGSV